MPIRPKAEKKNISPQRHQGHKGRNAKKEVAWRWVASFIVRVVRGHKGKDVKG
jgi:hypothetical protein